MSRSRLAQAVFEANADFLAGCVLPDLCAAAVAITTRIREATRDQDGAPASPGSSSEDSLAVWFVQNHCKDLRPGYDCLRCLRAAQAIIASKSTSFRRCYGTEFIAQKVRDRIAAVGAKTAYIEPGSPWENGYCESFNARFRPFRQICFANRLAGNG